jgi:putative peptidoglycan lipid II flippase
VIKQYLPMVAGGLLLGTAPMIDSAMAATLGSGSVSSLAYGTKIVALVLALGLMSIGTAVLPYFSRMIANGDFAAVRHTLRTFTGVICVGCIPVTIGLIALSPTIIRLVFERGSFTAEDTEVVNRIQMMSALQIPFFVLSILLVRLISAMKANSVLAIGTGISFVLNISLDYLLKEKMGVQGIALATTIVYVVSLTYLALMLRRILPTKEASFRHEGLAK